MPTPLTGPVRVGGSVNAPRKIVDVRPLYPENARATGASGVVILDVAIATDGSVSNARVVRSIPIFDQAALDAVRQWKFEPTLLNGMPVEVEMAVTINFTTSE
jgi:protein TonB